MQHEQRTEQACWRLYRAAPHLSAFDVLAGKYTAHTCALALVVCALALTIIPGLALSTFIFVHVFYMANVMFKLILVITGAVQKHVSQREEVLVPVLSDAELPVYTVLVPLFKEAKIVTHLVEAIRQMDYPKDRLDVKLIVEEADQETIDAIHALHCEPYFEVIVVPYSLPQTKPKACNYALQFAKGEYVTIYDAEDMPEKSQLRRVAALFRYHPPRVACIQAKLNYYNRDANLLTRMFAYEYGIWFEYMLRGLEAMRVPVPLGGTSNHIRRDVLEQLHGWDPHNVTEDADLGIRMARFGYEVKVVDSLTEEEAVMSWPAWLRQRTRWIKGYMQTYLVHMRDPVALYRSIGLPGFAGFQLFVGAPALLFLLGPVMWGSWLVLGLGGAWLGINLPEWVRMVAMGNLWIGFGLGIVLPLWICVLFRWWSGLFYCIIYPFYWIGHSIASFRAVWQLFTRPYYWDKTEHGKFSLDKDI